MQRFGKRLLSHHKVDVGGIAGEYELVVVSLGSEGFGHTLVGEYIARGFRNKQNFINAIYFHYGGWISILPALNSRKRQIS